LARRLLLLAGIAILAVILFHGAGWGLTALLAWSERVVTGGIDLADAQGTPTYLIFRLIEQAAVFAIPAFLFVSGFFVVFATPRASPAPAWNVILRRVSWLLIPYLVWSLIVWIELGLQGTRFSPAQYAALLLTGATTPAYYYVPVLVQLYLLSPFLVRWAKAGWWSLLALGAVVQVTVSLAPLSVLSPTSPVLTAVAGFPKWVFLPHVFWFVLGILVSLHLPRLRGPLARWRYGFLATAGGLFVVGLLEWEWLLNAAGGWVDHRMTLVDSLYALALLLAFVGLAEAGLGRRPSLEAVGAQSYGIYLVHPPVMEAFARGVYHFASPLLALPLLFSTLVMAAGLGIPLALMAIVRRTPLRAGYRFLFG
jgi:surface polysaccharide O-acyltransferase-like enzyme